MKLNSSIYINKNKESLINSIWFDKSERYFGYKEDNTKKYEFK